MFSRSVKMSKIVLSLLLLSLCHLTRTATMITSPSTVSEKIKEDQGEGNIELDENFEEMTMDNISVDSKASNETATGEDASERSNPADTEILDEERIDQEIQDGEPKQYIKPYKLVLIICGAAVGLIFLVVLIILALKSALIAKRSKPENSKNDPVNRMADESTRVSSSAEADISHLANKNNP